MTENLEYLRNSETELDIELIYSEEEDYNSSPSEYQITTYPADFTLEILANKLNSGEIIVPKFQRGFVWKQVQASKLIESFLVGLPVPPIFLYKEIKTNKLLLIDGQQRLKTIKYFLEGFFGEEVKGKKQIFRLTGLNKSSKWYNKTYEELEENDVMNLKNAVLRAFVIQQLNPNDDSSVYHIFERLNTGGTFLNNQEIRNCIYYGELNDLIKNNLNLHPSYRLILGKEFPDMRMVDQELIVRFFSMLEITNYDKPLKDFMSKFMRLNRNPDIETQAKLERIFKNTCDIVIKSIGEKPFHIKRGINTAVYDCVMVSFAHNYEKAIPENIVERYKSLVAYLETEKLVTSATTNKETVINRFAAANRYLFD